MQNVEQLKIEQLISASSNGFVYVRVEITNPDNDADFKINFNWDLKKYSVEPTLDKLNFVQSGEFYEVSIAPDAEGEVIVPATYMGKQVKIAEPQEGGSYLGGHEDKYTFTGSFTNLKNVTKVTLMKGITEIPAKAFIVDFTKDEDASVKIMQVLNSSDLQEIVIPDSVTTIGAWAFWCCQNLTTVTLGKGAKTSEESYIFSGCSALENIFYTGTVEEWISNISPICRDRENYYGISDPYVNLFTKEGLLTSYTFTNNIEIIPFCSIKSLQTLTIGSEVTSIKTYDVCDFSRSISLNEIILDSETIYNEIKYVSSVEYLTNNLQSGSGTIKVLNTIDATSNSYVTSNFTLSGTEDIGGKTYNVYTKN